MLTDELEGWVQELPEAVECEFTTSSPAPPDTPTCYPWTPPDWVRYAVAPDDTLSAIALRTGTSVAELQLVNCLPNTIIRIGQVLRVPQQVCNEVIITHFSVTTRTDDALVAWQASGGCAPLSGTLTARYIDPSSVERYAVSGTGTQILTFPASCPATAQYSISVRDSSGRGASVVKTIFLPDYCYQATPTPTATATLAVTSTPTATPTPTATAILAVTSTPTAIVILAVTPTPTATPTLAVIPTPTATQTQDLVVR